MASSGVGFTVGSRSLRAVEVRRKGGAWQVVDAVARSLAAGDDPGRAAEAGAALAAAGVKGPSLIGLSGKDLIVRYTRAPRVPDWRLEMLMRFEIEEVAEQSGGDVAADWALLTLPAAAGEDDTVLVALARNAHLRPRLDAARGAGLPVLGGCPRSIALYHAFVTNGAVPPGEVTLLLHLGGENTDVAIQRDGALLFARNMAGGGQPFTDALVSSFRVPEETAERMKVQKGNLTPRQKARYADSSEEKVANTLLGTAGNVVAAVHSSLMFCKAQTKLADLRIDRVVVSGAGARIRGMCEYLASGLGIPVEPFDPFETVDLTALGPEAAAMLREDGPSMAAALGLAQMAADPKAFRLEILPEADRKKRQFVQHTAWLLASGAVAVAGLVFLYSTAGAEEAKAAANEKELNKAIETANRLRDEGAQKREKVEAAVRRLQSLRGEVGLGPSFERAMAVAQEVVASSPVFQAVHFHDVKARYTQLEIPKEFLPEPDPEAAEEEPDRSRGGRGARDEGPPQARVPVIVFSGKIQQRDREPARVFADFTAALQAEVKRLIPQGIMISEKSIASNDTFEVKVAFFEGYRMLEGR